MWRVLLPVAVLVVLAAAKPLDAGAAVAEGSQVLLQAGENNGYGYSFSGAVTEFKNSFYLSIIGIIMCCIAFPCLYWNEGRAVTREVTLGHAKKQAKDIGKVNDSYKPDSTNNGMLVRFDGKPNVTVPLQQDTQFGVKSQDNVHAKRIERTVEMYQWITKSHTETRRTNETDSNGNYKTEQIRVIDPPEQAWSCIPVGTLTPTQPELPDTLQGNPKYINRNEFAISSQSFHQGRVKLGPYNLTFGMVDQEMKTETENATFDVAAILSYVSSGGSELTGEDLQGGAEGTSKADDETSKADESTGLLDTRTSSGCIDGTSDHGPGPLSSASKDFLQSHDLKYDAQGNYAYIGDLADPRIGDYRISWAVKKLPTDASGQVTQHTVIAEQKDKGSGRVGLCAWIPEGVEEFHLDSCCKYVCCCGYSFVAESEEGGCGCISKIDSCVFPNASSDHDEDGATGDIESQSAASNSRKVEKILEGEHSVDEIIANLSDANEEKTWFYRKAGFLLMFFGFQFVMDPLPTLFHFIPFIGHAVGFLVAIAVFLVACALGCFGSITTVSVAWLRYRPLWGILGILVSGGIAAAVCLIKPPA